VDVHTGVEDASGRKKRAKVLEFMAEARAAFGESLIQDEGAPEDASYSGD
jgi:hypothetical protein